MRWFRKAEAARETGPAANPFELLLDGLRADGLLEEAAALHTLLHEMAWTTGSELLGELGLAMRRMRPGIRRRGSPGTKDAFKSAIRAVRKA